MANISMSKIDFFSTTRITRLVQTLANELEISQPLTFLNRTPIVPVLDDTEIIGSYSGPIFAADLITEDAEAVVVEGGKFEMTGSLASIPKIKIGARVSESIIRRLNYLKQGIQLSGDSSVITAWELSFAQNLVTGVRQRMNQLCAAMALDSYTYDRLGVKLAGSFGMPSNLKSDPNGASRPWSSTTLATPITDIQTLVQGVAIPTYGKEFNRVTMATTAFQALVATDEFKERVRLLWQLEPSQFSFNAYDVANNKNLFTQVSGMQLELEDTQMRVRETNGNNTQTRILPANMVILSNSADDNSTAAFDFANGIVTESIVAPMIAGAPDFGGEQVGPVAFYNGNRELNPPDLRCWAVARGFPRKHDKYATATIKIGS